MKEGTKLFIKIIGHHENAVTKDVLTAKTTITHAVDDKQFYEDLIVDAITEFKEKQNRIYQPREITVQVMSLI